MKTKLFSLFLMLVISIGTIFASDTSVKVGGIWYNFYVWQAAEVTYHGSYYCQYSDRYSGDVIIPSSVTYGGKTYTVESISAEAFRNCRGLTSVTIPHTVTRIGEKAFYDCTDLTSVHIHDIASWCSINFEGSYSNPLWYAHNLYCYDQLITDLAIHYGVTRIRDRAFEGCHSLTSVKIFNSVTNIGEHAFNACTGLTSVTIPNSVTSIGNMAFSQCYSLTSVTIPNSVTSIENSAFWGSTGLTSVTIEAITPPTLGSGVFPNGIPLYVPCGTLNAYISAWTPYRNYVQYRPSPYIINVAGSYKHGSVDVTNGTICNNKAVLTATPDYGYHFVQWNDGNTDNPRTIELTQDTTFTASFAINTYLVRFFGFNNVLLESQFVEHGTAAVAPKAPIVDHYDFVGWDKSFLNVTSPLDVRAIYQKNTEGMKNVYIDYLPRKVINDGQILILRGDRTYTVTGQELR